MSRRPSWGAFSRRSWRCRRQAALGHDVTRAVPPQAVRAAAGAARCRFAREVARDRVPYSGRLARSHGPPRARVRRREVPIDVRTCTRRSRDSPGGCCAPFLATGGVVAYSPHGFAFLRESLVPHQQRRGARRRACAGAAVRRRHPRLALRGRRRPRAARARSATVCAAERDPGRRPPTRVGQRRGSPVVVASGRLGEQKAPDRFAAIARALGDRAEFVWIGDGVEGARERWIGDAPVRVTGWLAHERGAGAARGSPTSSCSRALGGHADLAHGGSGDGVSRRSRPTSSATATSCWTARPGCLCDDTAASRRLTAS